MANAPVLCSAKYIPSDSAASMGRIPPQVQVMEPEPSTTAMAFSRLEAVRSGRHFHAASSDIRSVSEIFPASAALMMS